MLKMISILKFNYIKLQRLSIALFSILYCSLGRSYETDTHRLLTQEAFKRSVIYQDASLMTTFGLPPLEIAAFRSYVGETPTPSGLMSVAGLLSHGAYHEDNISQTVSFNHFYDPQWNGGVGRGLTVIGTLGVPSPQWILEQSSTHPGQYYSYRLAKRAFLDALTNPNPENRSNSTGLMFQALGHIVHHIQDMGQPQHVRNEPHLHDEHFPFTNIDFTWSFAAAGYELYTRQQVDAAKMAEIMGNNSYPIPKFDFIDNYWYTSSGGYVGMADFTSKNYTMYKGGYIVAESGGVSVVTNSDVNFPLPNGRNADGSSKSLITLPLKISLRNGEVWEYPVDYLIGDVYDGYTNSSKKNQLLALGSIVTARSTGAQSRYFSGFHPTVWADAYNVLFPRAVAFSAGIINHFFRERIFLQKASGAGGGNHSVIIGNETEYTLSGEYEIYTEDEGGVRAPAVVNTYEKSWTIPPGKGVVLNPRWSMADNKVKKVVVVFTGNVGKESGACTGMVIPW